MISMHGYVVARILMYICITVLSVLVIEDIVCREDQNKKKGMRIRGNLIVQLILGGLFWVLHY